MCPRGTWLIPEFEPTNVSHCLLIETPSSGLILVDTGLGDAALRNPLRTLGSRAVSVGVQRDPAASALEQVRARGFDPADVQHIIPTHLDYDHAGGLVDFPDAVVHVTEVELAAAQDRNRRGFAQVRYDDRAWAHGPNWQTYDDDRGTGGWMGIDGVRPFEGLPPEFLLVPLAGHTLGQIGVAVDLPDGRRLLHAGDSYYARREVLAGRRSIRQRLFHHLTDADYLARKNVAWRCEEMIRFHPEIAVISSHDPYEWAAWRA